jgi:hypothetical protein
MSLRDLSHQGAALPQTGTGGADTVPERTHPRHSLPAPKAVRFIKASLWPFAVIAVAVLASAFWSATLFWLAMYAVW